MKVNQPTDNQTIIIYSTVKALSIQLDVKNFYHPKKNKVMVYTVFLLENILNFYSLIGIF